MELFHTQTVAQTIPP